MTGAATRPRLYKMKWFLLLLQLGFPPLFAIKCPVRSLRVLAAAVAAALIIWGLSLGRKAIENERFMTCTTEAVTLFGILGVMILP